tara:strand:- start:6484 stop:8586 length:2103 start_codon:yes stop_codon:yes gene_type:complete
VNSHSRLIQINSLASTPVGLWTQSGYIPDFNYSDGEKEEKLLSDIILNADDTSSTSIELENLIEGWATEYHLSPHRSNLLRYLRLDGEKTVLELGCGCGALTRYLGELDLSVDAVEGSIKRAIVAKERCRDLENVDIIASNFNDICFPGNHYDLITFVGVLEYAGRFSTDEKTAEQAVLHALKKCVPSLTENGAIVIAIENRLGKKYFSGAGEDHYGLAFEGIKGYPHYSGIKTWSRNEWIDILDQVDLNYSFHYPFPDYKLPSLVLNDKYVTKNKNAWTHLTGISFRDYHNLVIPRYELGFWEHAHKFGVLGSFANSFLIVANPKNNTPHDIAPYDFVHFSNIQRNPAYRTQTQKPCDTSVVKKIPLYNLDKPITQFLEHKTQNDKWIAGIPLSNIWIKELEKKPFLETLETLTSTYFSYLQSRFKNDIKIGFLVDLSPMNIMVDKSTNWHSFDHEWSYTLPTLDHEFVFFRGLFYFFENAHTFLTTISWKLPSITLIDVLAICFKNVGIDLMSNLMQYIDQEDELQKNILNDMRGISTKDILTLRLGKARTSVQLFWGENINDFAEAKSQTKPISIGYSSQTLVFTIPTDTTSSSIFRVDPGVMPGLFNITFMELSGHLDSKKFTLHRIQPSIFKGRQYITYNNIRFTMRNFKILMVSLNNDPSLIWRIPKAVLNQQFDHLEILVSLNWLGTDELSKN